MVCQARLADRWGGNTICDQRRFHDIRHCQKKEKVLEGWKLFRVIIFGGKNFQAMWVVVAT